MSHERHVIPPAPEITESEVWRQAYNAALTGTIAGDLDSTDVDFDVTCGEQAEYALIRYLKRWPR